MTLLLPCWQFVKPAVSENLVVLPQTGRSLTNSKCIVVDDRWTWVSIGCGIISWTWLSTWPRKPASLLSKSTATKLGISANVGRGTCRYVVGGVKAYIQLIVYKKNVHWTPAQSISTKHVHRFAQFTARPTSSPMNECLLFSSSDLSSWVNSLSAQPQASYWVSSVSDRACVPSEIRDMDWERHQSSLDV